jgi:hypothetical protein
MALNNSCSTQIVILGGGIAGLWLLNRLCNEGFDAVLLEKKALGGGQTLASQGIIHGGLKYALNGALSPASSAIADMPARWRQCLEGSGELDLSGCRLLSPNYYMWSDSSYRSRLKTFLGSKALRGRIDALKPTEYPAFFRNAAPQNAALKGTLYKLTDFVVDTPSLLRILSARYRDRIFHSPTISLSRNADNEIIHVSAEGPSGMVQISAQRYILCAGEGNETLLKEAGISKPEMQKRPLHMVCVHLDHPDPVFVHCIGDSFGMAPRLTITSHPLGDETVAGARTQQVWYIGGEIAEKGVNRSAAEQQHIAREELSSMFPWVDFRSAQWGSFFINRAEPKVSNLQRPDNAYVGTAQNLLITWPTKLTLSPDLGDAVLQNLRSQQLVPEFSAGAVAGIASPLSAQFKFPDFGIPRWDDMFR